MRKRGMMDDMFDFLFTVIVAFFLLFFVSGSLNGAVTKANTKSLDDQADFKRLEAAVNNLRVQSQQGLNLENVNIVERIANSKVLGGKTITVCNDYFDAVSCDNDGVAILQYSVDYTCGWSVEEKKCGVITRGASLVK